MGRASIPGFGHTGWSRGWLGDGAATAAMGVARAPALPCRRRALEGGRGREGEPGGGVGSGGGTTRALWCFSVMAVECRGAAGEAGRVSTMVGRELMHDDHVGK